MKRRLQDALDRAGAWLRPAAIERDPVLERGQEGRWQWPWAIAGLGVTYAVYQGMRQPSYLLEGLALQLGWLPHALSGEFPLDPRYP